MNRNRIGELDRPLSSRSGSIVSLLRRTVRMSAVATAGALALAGAGAFDGSSAAAVSVDQLIINPDDLTLPNLETLTFDAVAAEVTEQIESAGPVRLNIPGLGGIGPVTVDDGTVTIEPGPETITIEGPFMIDGKPATLSLSLDWDEDPGDLIPGIDERPVITFTFDLVGSIGNTPTITIAEAVSVINDLSGATFDATSMSPTSGLINAGLTFVYDTADGTSALDLVGGFRLVQPPDDLVVDLLLAMTDRAGNGPGNEPVLITGIKLTSGELFDDAINLRQVFRGTDLLASAAELELPETTMAMVQPDGADVRKTCPAADSDCIPWSERVVNFFGATATELPDDQALGNTLTLAANVRLDSFGDDVRQAFGYEAGATTLLVGEVGFDLTSLADGTFDLQDVSLTINLPDLAPGEQALLPDWLRVSDASLTVEYDDALPGIVITAEAQARVSVPSQSIDLAVDLAGQITIDETAATIALRAEPAPGSGWDNVFGLTWLDLNSIGVEATIIAPEGGPVDLSGAVTSSFDIAGETFSVRIALELTPELAATITVSYDDQISVYDVLDVVGVDTSALPANLNATLGPVSITARIDDGPPKVTVGATGALPFFGPGSAQWLFSVVGDDVVFGVRSGNASLESVIGSDPFQIGGTPTIALVGNNSDFETNAFNLSPEEDEFWRELFGCGGDPRPPTCGYSIDLDAGIHVITSFQLPNALSGLRDVLPMLWIDPTSGLLLDAKAPFPAAGQNISLSDLSIRAVLPAIVPPVPEGPDAINAYPDWFERARLAFQLSPAGFEIVGELAMRLRDQEVEEAQTPTNAACTRSWRQVFPGSDAYACYDLLDFEISAGIEFTVPPKLTLGGALLTEPGVGWQQPFGIEFLRVDAARLQLGLAIQPTGAISVDMGLLAAGALFDKDFSGSIAFGLTIQSIPAPPFVTVVPTFGGLRLSSQAGLEVADLVGMYQYVVESAESLGLPAIAPDLSQLPNLSLRNLDLMIGVGSYPKLCIEPGFKIGGTFHINAPPLTVAPPNPPGGCNPGLPVADPVQCAADATCFASALVVATIDDGIIVSGSLGEFDIGFLQCDQMLLDFRLTPAQQVLRVFGGCDVPTLLTGSVDLYIGLDGVTFRGDVELFPGLGSGVFRAMIEGEAAADLGQVDLSNPASLLALDFDFHAVLQTDFTGAIEEVLSPLIEDLRVTAETIDAAYSLLRESGDPLDVILQLPNLIEQAGGDVPQWLTDFADGLQDFRATLESLGVAMPNINDVLGGFTATITEGTLGYYDPTSRECQTATLGFADGGEGTVIDGVCWDDPPGGPFNYEERGVFVSPQCKGLLGVPGFLVDGVCWAVPPTAVDVLGLSDIVPGTPASMAELLEDVDAIFAGILEDLPGVPNNLSLSTLLQRLADKLDAAESPVDVPCADIRLDSVEGSTTSTLTVRLGVVLFGDEIGLDTGWDFSQPPLTQAAGLFDDVVATIFGSAPPVTCEPLGTTTLAQGGGAPADGSADPSGAPLPSLTGFTVETDPAIVSETGAVTATVTFNIAVPTATNVAIAWGDGSTESFTVPAGQQSADRTHTYADDSPSGTAVDPVLISVTSIGRTETASINVRNTAPSGLVVSVTPSNEGATATLHGDFTDPGLLDSHSVRVVWGDGTSPQVVTLASGARSFDIAHVYADDSPTATAIDQYPVAVTVRDDDTGQTTQTATATVSNVRPSNVVLTPVLPAGVTQVNEGRLTGFGLTFVDPGIRDSFVVTVDWGDGTPVDRYLLSPGQGTTLPAVVNHRYADDNPTATASDIYSVVVSVADDDEPAAPTTVTTAVTVHNVAPVIDVEVTTPVIDEDGTAIVIGSISDPGRLDTFTLTIDWGDGSTPTERTLAQGTREFTSSHRYLDDNPSGTSQDDYTITVTIVDDDTGVGTLATGVTVRNVDPAVSVDENLPGGVAVDFLTGDVKIDVQYSDPIAADEGFVVNASDVAGDPLTASVVAGGGNSTLASLLTASVGDCAVDLIANTNVCAFTISSVVNPATGIFTDIAPGVYTVQVVVSDDDLGETRVDVEVTVHPEDGRVYYVGPTFAATTSAAAGSATIELRATIRDITSAIDPSDPSGQWDPWPGDIRNASLAFVDRDPSPDLALCAALGVDEVFEPFDVFVPARNIGVGTCNWTSLLSSSENAHSTNVGTIAGAYYTRNDPNDDTLVTVARPLGEFITGGGYIVATDSAGVYASADGTHANYGLNVKFNKKRTTLQGQVNLIVRSNGHVYQIKSNSITSLGITTVAGLPVAEFESKANITDVTDPNNPIVLGGNFTLQMRMTEVSEFDATDKIAFSLWDIRRNKNGSIASQLLLYSSNWTGNTTQQQVIGGGNLFIHQ